MKDRYDWGLIATVVAVIVFASGIAWLCKLCAEAQFK